MKTTLSERAKGIGHEIAKADRRSKTESLLSRIDSRIEWLKIFNETRFAAFPLKWAVETGRSSTEFEMALMKMSPAKFAQVALDISEQERSVRDSWESWKAAVSS